MIEKVARVLAFDHHRTEDNWQEWSGVARSVIEAMRDPTGEMIDAGAETYEAEPWVTGCSLDGQPSKAWRAMVDAALGENV